MLTHKQVWDGIDRLAAKNGLSASGLAKRAGLDPTTFNKSKRVTKQGKPRWPSTESLSKVLDATSCPMSEFVSLMDDAGGVHRRAQRIRCVSLSQIEHGAGLDTTGFPVAGRFDEIEFPAIDDEHVYMVELDRDIAPPFLRSGDQVVVTPSAGIRRGDRVIGRLRDGSVVFGTLVRRTAQRAVIQDVVQPTQERTISSDELAWLARVVWSSQ